MSARVVNRIAFSEFKHIQSPIKLRQPKGPSMVSKQRIKRDLFGPFDRDSSRRLIIQEIMKQQKQAEQKWGFDFMRGTPVDSHHQYIWERVPPTIVPEMYALSRAAHVREIACCDETSERLMDERAAAIFRLPQIIETEVITTANNKITRTIQPKITDYLQERKRPSVNSIKRLQSVTSPAKKLRRALSMNDSPTIAKQT